MERNVTYNPGVKESFFTVPARFFIVLVQIVGKFAER